jgi:ribosome-binding protein aMBF1 (putative translation factor)
MSIALEEMIKRLPKARRERIRKQTAKLMEEYASLQDLRMARSHSQNDLAGKLKVKQAAVSKLERRKDMNISTLRSMIEALGGKLEILARFPDNKPIRIRQFEG